MDNIEKLKKYLIGDNDDGYLLKEISNGKVIMLSGEWGSGKTHFWKNEIEPKFQKKPYAYVSLYGKTSIALIENDLYMQIYSSINNEGDFISKASSTLISTYAKVFKPLSIIDAVESEKLVVASKHKKAIEALQQNALICFDDFERKSKDVDLNDLFGFITQLVLNFNCKVVLVLNSDVFEEKEKAVFTNVKEKTVSKYLKFSPTCSGLFELIIKDDKYDILRNDNDSEIEKVLKNTFCEIAIVNARILIQVLDNVLEWNKKQDLLTPFYIRYLVLVNINFILNHHVFKAELRQENLNSGEVIQNEFGEEESAIKIYADRTKLRVKSNVEYEYSEIEQYIAETTIFNPIFIDNLIVQVQLEEKENGTKSNKADFGEILLDLIKKNPSFIKSLHFMYCFHIQYGESHNEVEVSILNEINDFIETGIL